MPKVAAAFAFDSTPNPDTYRDGVTRVIHAPVVSDSTPRFVLQAGTKIGEAWALHLPLLFDLSEGDEGVFASALNGSAHGYGKKGPHAVESLLDAMVDTLESLNATHDDQLDGSAIRLRELLRRQLCQIHP